MCQSRDMTRNTRKSVNSSEHGRLSQNQYIIVSLNFPDSKMGTWVTYCESLDEFYVPKSRYDLKHKKISENQLILRIAVDCKATFYPATLYPATFYPVI